jgi:plastocyanin
MAVALFLPTNAAAYDEITVTNGGTIKGKVIFTGSQKDANKYNKVYTITKDKHVCGTGKRKVDYVKVQKDKKDKLRLSDVVVYLDKKKVGKRYKSLKKGKAFAEDVENATIDQKACAFLPFFAVVKRGGTLTAVNSDSVGHNIHTYKILNKGNARPTLFNVSQPNEGDQVNKDVDVKDVKTKKQPNNFGSKSRGMKVECDQHDFMHSFVFVAKNPYYAVVEEDGTYTIDNIPPGKYRVKAWHGYLKNPKAKTVTVKAGKTKTRTFKYKNKKK